MDLNINTIDDNTQEYVIAYLDMLGTKNKINGANSKIEFNKLYGIYKLAQELIGNFPNNTFNELRIKIFSDNIVIAKKISEEKTNILSDIKELIDYVALFQGYSLAAHNWYIRGGITKGKFFIDDIMVWGLGLIRSYYLESQIAIYPRIIIDENIIEIIHNSKSILSDYIITEDIEIIHNSKSILSNYIITEDFDHQYFIDYIHRIPLMNGIEGSLSNIKNGFLIEWNKNNKDDRIKQKLYWHAKYINNYLETYDKQEYRININELK